MKTHDPPGPKDWLLGIPQTARMRRDILGYYHDMHSRFGDIVRVRLGNYRYYIVFHPDAVRELLVTKADCFERMPSVRRIMGQWNGQSLLIAEGEAWMRQRRLVRPAFQPRRFAAYADTIVTHAGRFVEDQVAKCRAAGGAREVEIGGAMTALTMAIISQALFGADLSDDARDVARAVAILSEVAVSEMQSPLHAPAWWPSRFQRDKRWAIATLDRVVWRIVRQRRASGKDEGDLLSMLLAAVDQEGDGRGMTDRQARDEAMTLLLAGHDTTAAGLIWTCHCLATHVQAAESARAQVDEVLGRRPATFADLPKLDQVERFVQEVLRLYPPAIGVFMRQATRKVELGGHTLAKGSLAQAISYFTHRDERWFPAPERFDPDRFLPENVERRPQFAYFPFGGGPRACIGAHFAMMEMTLVTATILSRLELSPAAGGETPVLDAKMSLRPRGGLRLNLRERNLATV